MVAHGMPVIPALKREAEAGKKSQSLRLAWATQQDYLLVKSRKDPLQILTRSNGLQCIRTDLPSTCIVMEGRTRKYQVKNNIIFNFVFLCKQYSYNTITLGKEKI
jgi:hypothetical protein